MENMVESTLSRLSSMDDIKPLPDCREHNELPEAWASTATAYLLTSLRDQ